MDTITFEHQDGDMTFPVSKATFAITPENRLTFSIRCEGSPEASWMADPLFCLVGFPLGAPLEAGTVIRFPGNADEWDVVSEGPRAHAYCGVHQLPRDVDVRVLSAAPDACVIELSWVVGDVKYYDGRARRNRAVGRCTLKRGAVEDMWIPT